MTPDRRIAALETQHAGLEALLAREESRPGPDPLKEAEIKKRKLWIKDKLTGLRRQPAGRS